MVKPDSSLSPSGAAVGNLFRGGPANVSWERALEGLDAADAARVPAGLPHSVAEVVTHVVFWQERLLASAGGQPAPWPQHATEGWPIPGGPPEHWSADAWATLTADLLAGQERLRALSRDPQFSARTEGTPGGVPWAVMLVNFAGHGVYHLGQVVLIRQALGLWPPPSGGDTW